MEISNIDRGTVARNLCRVRSATHAHEAALVAP
jgi:hypothetical protein